MKDFLCAVFVALPILVAEYNSKTIVLFTYSANQWSSSSLYQKQRTTFILPKSIFVSKFYSILHPQFLTPIYEKKQTKKLSKHNF